MANTLRQKWDLINDCPSALQFSAVDEYKKFHKAFSKDIPDYRVKLVQLVDGQVEVSVTPTELHSVINARMGFNPLLDSPRLNRDPAEQAQRDIENLHRAGKRAKQKVRYIVKNLLAGYMLTFSYRELITDRHLVAKHWKEFIRLYRQRFPDWQYVAVLEKQERGSFHMHVAVSGKQQIKWLLRCWLYAIGQSHDDVTAWMVHGKKLGDKSFGAVNVSSPNKRWGGVSKKWKRDKLAGYLTKYIGKDFDDSEKNSKKYWHSRNIVKPMIRRFWLHAKTYLEAIKEAHFLIYSAGATNISFWNSHEAGVIWITADTVCDDLLLIPDIYSVNSEFIFMPECETRIIEGVVPF